MSDVRRIGRWRPVAETGDRCPGNGVSCPLRSLPRKRLRGVKFAKKLLEPTPNRGTTPSAWE